MALKNTYTKKGVDIFGKIQKILATGGVKRVMFDYDGNGRIKGLAFMLRIAENEYLFKMPARVENVEKIMLDAKEGKETQDWELTLGQKEQAYRIAWSNIRDWLDSQMAMKAIGLVKLEEVFLPYLVVSGEQTLFEKMQESKFLISPGNK